MILNDYRIGHKRGLARGLSIVSTTEEAEEVAKQWMKHKYSGKIAKSKFNQVMLQNGIWTIRADIEIRKGVLQTVPWTLIMRIDANTTNVIGYTESPRPASAPS
jgi:hypothetical protein